jgi:hypothetical protein
MKFAMIFVIVLGIIFAVPLVIQGIKYNEPGFWMLVGFVILGMIAMRWKLGQLNRNKAKRERPLTGMENGP